MWKGLADDQVGWWIYRTAIVFLSTTVKTLYSPAQNLCSWAHLEKMWLEREWSLKEINVHVEHTQKKLLFPNPLYNGSQRVIINFYPIANMWPNLPLHDA